MELKIINTNGQNVGSMNVADDIFAREYNEALVHQVVNAFLANARQGTRSQKSRGQVAKSTRKPFKQKGTGRARAGMASSPLWKGGGKIFPNMPDENFSQKVNRKMYRAAISVILSQLIRDDRFVVADQVTVNTHKTKEFLQLLKNMALDNKKAVLIVVDDMNEQLFLAARNLVNVILLETHQIDPYTLLRCEKVIFVSKVVEQIQERLA